MIVATETCLVTLGEMPEAALIEFGEMHTISGGRDVLIRDITDLLLRSTYTQLAPMFAALKTIAEKHGVGDLVTIEG